MLRRPRVALLVESSRAYGRGLLRGIAAYIQDHRPWSLYTQERMMSDDAPAWLRNWKGDGIIARIESPQLIAALGKLDRPTIDLRGMHDLPGIPLIETNDKSVTRLAVAHLLERGFPHYAFCGYQGANFSARRLSYFLPLMREAGHEPFIYEGAAKLGGGNVTLEVEGHGLMYEAGVADWVMSLPKPAAIMACNDVRGQQLLNACRDRGVAVPDDVAVIGVDNDELICDLCDPPLTSVEPDTDRIGYEAAALLDRMMAGRKAPQRKTFIEPRGLVARQSTDVLALSDRQVAAAVRFIREHACEGIDVEQVLDQVTISRSTLERRFAAVLGHSPKDHITRVQIDRVKQLLAQTSFSLEKIADLSGFGHTATMCHRFKQTTGQTPGALRRKGEMPVKKSKRRGTQGSRRVG